MTVIGGLLIGVGVGLILIAAVGVLRLPDALTRMNAATKAAGLGVAGVFAGVALLNPSANAVVKMLLAIAIHFATAPVAGHVIGRAAYRAGIPLWDETVVDELATADGQRNGR